MGMLDRLSLIIFCFCMHFKHMNALYLDLSVSKMI